MNIKKAGVVIELTSRERQALLEIAHHYLECVDDDSSEETMLADELTHYLSNEI